IRRPTSAPAATGPTRRTRARSSRAATRADGRRRSAHRTAAPAAAREWTTRAQYSGPPRLARSWNVHAAQMSVAGDQTRARLLAEARDHFLAVGFARFSLREVARRAHVSATAVYRHFDDQEGLLRAVGAEGSRLFESYLLRAMAAPTARERLIQSAIACVRFAMQHPRDYQFLFIGGGAYQRTFGFLVDRARDCLASPGASDPIQVATGLWAQLHGRISLLVAGYLAPADDATLFEDVSRAAEQALKRLAG